MFVDKQCVIKIEEKMFVKKRIEENRKKCILRNKLRLHVRPFYKIIKLYTFTFMASRVTKRARKGTVVCWKSDDVGEYSWKAQLTTHFTQLIYILFITNTFISWTHVFVFFPSWAILLCFHLSLFHIKLK